MPNQPPPSAAAMRQFILEVPPGADVIQSIASFAFSGAHAAVTVLSASGLVSNVVLQNGGAHRRFATLRGAHRLVSLSGYFITVAHGGYGSFGAILTFASGQVIGGAVVGSLIVAARPITVVVAASSHTGSVFMLPLLAGPPY